MERQKLPVGIENFAEIRTEGFYYVDRSTCSPAHVVSARR